MAQPSWYTGDATANTFNQDFSALMLVPPMPGGELTVINLFAKAADGTEPTAFEWIEEQLSAISFASADATLDATDAAVTLTLATGGAAKINARTGMILWDSTAGKRETVYVSSVSGDALTVTRDYGGLFGSNANDTHASGAIWKVVDKLNLEGSGPPTTPLLRNRDPYKNYYTLTDEYTQITGSDMSRIYRGAHPDNWAYQTDGVKTAIERRMELSLIHGRKVERTSSVMGSMGGIIDIIEERAGDNIVTSADTFDYEVFDDAVKFLFEANGEGALDPVLIVPIAGLQVVPYIDQAAMQGDYQQTHIRGLYARMLQSTVRAQPIPVIGNVNMPADSMLLIDRHAVKIHFLVNRALRMYVNEVGFNQIDMQSARWISEYTMEFQNADTRAYYQRGLTYDRTAV